MLAADPNHQSRKVNPSYGSKDPRPGCWIGSEPMLDHICPVDTNILKGEKEKGGVKTELEKAIFLFEKLKLAHTIARAVDSDAVAIDESKIEETQ
ncbi:hypothetical protein S40293_11555 [Stachybotrys chartarum IBT 40293]|nr:hypothetical protein S40293_11555 [Stachybotrys chartarum IBT 40293]